MKSLKIFAAALLAVCPLAAQSSSTARTPVTKPFHQIRESWQRGFNSGNADAVLALYADNAVVVGSAGVFKGREAIRRWVQAGIDQGSRLDPIEAIEEKSSGTLAYATGTSRRWVGKELHRGRYLIVMERTAGGWRIVQHFSMNIAADAPQ